MKVYVISFCHPEQGVFGLIGEAFFEEEKCKQTLHLLQEEEKDFEFTMDDLDVEVVLQ